VGFGGETWKGRGAREARRKGVITLRPLSDVDVETKSRPGNSEKRWLWGVDPFAVTRVAGAWEGADREQERGKALVGRKAPGPQGPIWVKSWEEDSHAGSKGTKGWGKINWRGQRLACKEARETVLTEEYCTRQIVVTKGGGKLKRQGLE